MAFRDWFRGPPPDRCRVCSGLYHHDIYDLLDHLTKHCRPPTPELRAIYAKLDEEFPAATVSPTEVSFS